MVVTRESQGNVHFVLRATVNMVEINLFYCLPQVEEEIVPYEASFKIGIKHLQI